jgi:hypothetical protein
VAAFTHERIVAALRELGARAWSRGIVIDLAVVWRIVLCGRLRRLQAPAGRARV